MVNIIHELLTSLQRPPSGPRSFHCSFQLSFVFGSNPGLYGPVQRHLTIDFSAYLFDVIFLVCLSPFWRLSLFVQSVSIDTHLNRFLYFYNDNRLQIILPHFLIYPSYLYFSDIFLSYFRTTIRRDPRRLLIKLHAQKLSKNNTKTRPVRRHHHHYIVV